VKQRCGEQVHVLGALWHRRVPVSRVRDEVAVTQHHALRGARRAAGVEESREVRDRNGGRLSDEPRHVRGGQQGLVLVTERDHALDAVGERSGGTVGQQHACAGIAGGVFELRGRVTCAERHDHKAGGGHADVGLEVLVSIARENRNAIARREPERAQTGPEPRAAGAELCKRESPVAVDDGDPLGATSRRLSQGIGDRLHRT
jgi:hypothetical protein